MVTHKFIIEDRRRKVATLLAQSMTENEIAGELNVDQSTISRDIKVLKTLSQRFVFDLTKYGDDQTRKWYSDYLQLMEYKRNSNYGRTKCFHCLLSPDNDDPIFFGLITYHQIKRYSMTSLDSID